MITNCPHCGSAFDVDDALAGTQVACSNCGETFVVTSSETPVASPVLSADDSRGGFTYYSPIVLLIGSLAVITAFWLPWWRESRDEPDVDPSFHRTGYRQSDLRQMREDAREKDRDYTEFAGKYGLQQKLDREVAELPRPAKGVADSGARRRYTIYVWGSETLPGVLGIAFAPVIAAWAIVVLAVRPLRRWSWVGAIVCFVLSTTVFVLGLLWLFNAPRVGFEYTIEQWRWRSDRTLQLGVFLATFGALLACTRSMLEGANGLIHLAKRRRGAPRP